MGRPGSLRVSAFLIVVLVLASTCDGSRSTPAPSAATSPSTAPDLRPCPARVDDCLAWDDFDRASGPIPTALSGQTWETWGLNCPGCVGPALTTDGDKASLVPANDQIQVWLATVDSGRATGVQVSAEITTSSAHLRTNVGLVALFADLENHLTCKIELTRGNPRGLLAIGDERADVTTSLLASKKDLDLEDGTTYRLALTVPSAPDRRDVRCGVSGGGIRPTSVSHRLTRAELAAYGGGTGQGLRIKIHDDEDDGGSTWDDFVVRPVV